MPSPPRKVYLDYGSACPLAPEARQAMEPFLGPDFGSLGALNRYGKPAKQAVERARDQIRGLVSAPAGSKVIFTSGATEANNLALRGYCLRNRRYGDHLIVSQAAHISVLSVVHYLEKRDFQVTRLPVDEHCRVDPARVAEALTHRTLLVSLLAANNEVGTLQPLQEVGALLADRPRTVLHIDARVGAGRIPLDMAAHPIDLLSLSSNDLYGPRGVGALLIRPRLRLQPLILGGDQEQGLRAGREDVAGIVGFGAAAELAAHRLAPDAARLSGLRDRLIQGATAAIPGSALNGHPAQRLPTNLNLRFSGVEGETLLHELDGRGIGVAAGSVCMSKSLEPSHVLKAMGLSFEQAMSSIQMNLGRETTEEDIDYVLEVLPKAVERVRGMAGHRSVSGQPR